MKFPMKDKVVIITGASSGIGEAVALDSAAQGARVVLAARRAERLEALGERITKDGGASISIETDVTDRASVSDMVTATIGAFGRVDVLVNNAGIMPLSPIRQLRVDDWDRMIDVNVKGLLYCVAAVLPAMFEQGAGHIINVSSVAGRRPFPGGSLYSATKAAVRMISEGLRLELSPSDKIRVTDIEPGVVATELMGHIPDPTVAERFETGWSDKRKLESEDIAAAIRYVMTQPDHVNVNEILVRPTDQEN